jgi:mannose/cellobiose epimerase-like protein (N-acyl-D-glucosamine 2-epimerase family)
MCTGQASGAAQWSVLPSMAREEESLVEARLTALCGRLHEWLVGAAYPLWSSQGVDPRNGGFVEALDQDGTARPDPRRARVQPRQLTTFAQAPTLGWRGDVTGIVRRGADYLVAHYLREDGLYRTLAGVDGAALDERALLYDQAFVLLGFASAAITLDARAEFERRALDLRDQIEKQWRGASGGFCSGEVDADRRESNPHMHLLEACLAWSEIGNDPGWAAWVDEIADLAVARFINPASGALGEAFTASWSAAPGLPGRVVEPGHQFEWAWLLLQCQRRNWPARRAHALRLIAIGEDAGVHGTVAINTLLDDLSVHDPNARLWPQTERLKSALLAASITGDSKHSTSAADAAASLFPYLDTAIAGLWFDLRLPNGTVIDSPAPASSFYHIVGGIAALDAALRQAAARHR